MGARFEVRARIHPNHGQAEGDIQLDEVCRERARAAACGRCSLLRRTLGIEEIASPDELAFEELGVHWKSAGGRHIVEIEVGIGVGVALSDDSCIARSVSVARNGT